MERKRRRGYGENKGREGRRMEKDGMRWEGHSGARPPEFWVWNRPCKQRPLWLELERQVSKQINSLKAETRLEYSCDETRKTTGGVFSNLAATGARSRYVVERSACFLLYHMSILFILCSLVFYQSSFMAAIITINVCLCLTCVEDSSVLHINQ